MEALCKNCGHEIRFALKGKLFKDWYHVRLVGRAEYAKTTHRYSNQCPKCKCYHPESSLKTTIKSGLKI